MANGSVNRAWAEMPRALIARCSSCSYSAALKCRVEEREDVGVLVVEVLVEMVGELSQGRCRNREGAALGHVGHGAVDALDQLVQVGVVGVGATDQLTRDRHPFDERREEDLVLDLMVAEQLSGVALPPTRLGTSRAPVGGVDRGHRLGQPAGAHTQSSVNEAVRRQVGRGCGGHGFPLLVVTRTRSQHGVGGGLDRAWTGRYLYRAVSSWRRSNGRSSRSMISLARWPVSRRPGGVDLGPEQQERAPGRARRRPW